MRSVKVQWVLGFKQKQWLSDEVFRNIIDIQKHNWTNNALCESTLRCGLEAEALTRRRSFSKHSTHSNIQLNKICALWMYTEVWAWSRSIDSQKKFFKTLYTFKHTIEQIMRSVKVHRNLGFKQKQRLAKEFFITLYTFKHTIEQSMRSVKAHWMVGFKQKQWLPEEVFRIILHIQTNNWRKHALCEGTVSGGLEAEAMVFRNSFSKH